MRVEEIEDIALEIEEQEEQGWEDILEPDFKWEYAWEMDTMIGSAFRARMPDY